MNRLVRLARRRPAGFATRRILPLGGHSLRRYASQQPSPESLYAQYLESLKQQGTSSPISFEAFKTALPRLDADERAPSYTGDRIKDSITPAEGWQDDDITPPALFDAIRQLESSDHPNYSKTLANMAESVHHNMAELEGETGSSMFRARLRALDVENSPEDEVAVKVARLVMTSADNWDLEQIENKLATYDGPLARLNVLVEWYLENPDEIPDDGIYAEESVSESDEDSDEEYEEDSDAESDASESEGEEEAVSFIEEEEVAQDVRPRHDNNAYYSHDTPVDELARHLRKSDVQYVIQNYMDRKDRDELFRLMDSLVAPVFREHMPTLHAIADIFAKYVEAHEEVHLEYHTEPRLPRIRRLDVFKRLLPQPDDEGPVTQENEEKEIAEVVAQTKKNLESARAAKQARVEDWPNLMIRDPLLDSREVLELPPTKESSFHNRVVIRNHHSIFTEALHADGFDFTNHEPTTTDDVEEIVTEGDNLPITPTKLRSLILFTVIHGMSRLQTSKGNKDRIVSVVIAGDGNGMVGLGFGKHADGIKALEKGRADALRNMDWVERFEDRTIWTEVRTKFGATRVILRPRPVGFGLRCNPYIHRLLNAAGIKDVSAKVWGSRNPVGVLKATLRLLHAGHAPLGMGDGVGGRGRKSFKGSGLRNKAEIERARGRRLIDLRV
ncbi:hypothetical protein C8R43DRAFT_1064537 [Mycena crocata]|nr:hypothetical protein C8R43DRAFT_1064537 [Mycena crocata]